jgi:hypothetical protein
MIRNKYYIWDHDEEPHTLNVNGVCISLDSDGFRTVRKCIDDYLADTTDLCKCGIASHRDFQIMICEGSVALHFPYIHDYKSEVSWLFDSDEELRNLAKDIGQVFGDGVGGLAPLIDSLFEVRSSQ